MTGGIFSCHVFNESLKSFNHITSARGICGFFRLETDYNWTTNITERKGTLAENDGQLLWGCFVKNDLKFHLCDLQTVLKKINC